jgi:hypothetical protein
MLYFSSGSFGLNFDFDVCDEAVAIEANKVSQMRRFAGEAVGDFIAVVKAVKELKRQTSDATGTPISDSLRASRARFS